MKVLWTFRARSDLLEIATYISADSPTAARAWLKRLRLGTRKLAAFPHVGRKVPEFNQDDIREVLLRNYRIVYRILDDELHVLTVFECHRLLPLEIQPGQPETASSRSKFASRVPGSKTPG